jgi:hypothetical protein
VHSSKRLFKLAGTGEEVLSISKPLNQNYVRPELLSFSSKPGT